MTLCILSHFFLVRLKLRLGDKAPALTLPQVKHLLTGILPKREFDAQWILEFWVIDNVVIMKPIFPIVRKALKSLLRQRGEVSMDLEEKNGKRNMLP